jgi:hypothetical protein
MADNYYDERADNYYERNRPRKKPWYKKPGTWVLIVLGIIIGALLIAAMTGNLNKIKSPVGSNQSVNVSSNVTKEPTQEEKLVTYILEQQKAGVANEDIVAKLRIAGYTESDISSALELTDPYVQYIIEAQKQGMEKPAIVDALLKSGLTAEQVQEKFAIVDKHQQVGFGQSLKNNWLLILIILCVAGYFIFKGKGEEERKTPKIYSLEECREYAEKKLEEKGYKKNQDWWPTTKYKNRPELKQYRYVFDEPVFPEFNHHKPYGHRAGIPRYFLVAVGYDSELVEFRITDQDCECLDFLSGKPLAFETNANQMYLKMRQHSDMPLEDLAALQRPAGYSPGAYPGSPDYRPYNRQEEERKRGLLRRRFSPGPIEGYERRE